MSNYFQGVRVELERLNKKLDEIANLKQDWDSYGADQIDKDVIERVRKFLEEVPAGLLVCVDILPLNDGGLQVEFRRESSRAEVEFEPGGELSLVYVKHEAKTTEVVNLLIMTFIVCGNDCDCDDLADGEAFLCGECAEDMGIDVEEWEEPQPLTPQQQIDVMADLLRKKNRGEL